MNWLLITTAQRVPGKYGTNVGDEFARMGAERVIRAADDTATFTYLDKEDPDGWDAVPFDKAVVCGMPLFWSLPGNECQEMWWWPRLLRAWPSAVREKFMVFGAGHVYVDRINSLPAYTAAIGEVLDRAWALTVREPILDHPQVVDTVCPSAFNLFDAEGGRTRKLCNLMADGGHFGYLRADFSKRWNEETAPVLAATLQEEGFEFVAHTLAEQKLALALGWQADLVHLLDSAQEYLDLYRSAACYFGNRQHGAAVVASRGVPTWAFTHDSRVGMVRRLGGHTSTVDAATPEALMKWLQLVPAIGKIDTAYGVGLEYRRMVDLMKRFAAA